MGGLVSDVIQQPFECLGLVGLSSHAQCVGADAHGLGDVVRQVGACEGVEVLHERAALAGDPSLGLSCNLAVMDRQSLDDDRCGVVVEVGWVLDVLGHGLLPRLALPTIGSPTHRVVRNEATLLSRTTIRRVIN